MYTCEICEDRTYTSQCGYYRHMRSIHNIGRNGQKLRDVLKEISANATPQSVSEQEPNKDRDTNTSQNQSAKWKNTEPDPKPKKPKVHTATSTVVTWDCALCPGIKFSDNQEFMRHLYRDHQIQPQGNSGKK